MVLGPEAAIIVAVVGWFLAPNIKHLMDSAGSYAGNGYKWYRGHRRKLQELAEALELINGVVDEECRPRFVNNSAVINHLWNLKDAIHDAEELLDMFQYEIHEANLNMKKYNSVMRALDSTVDFGKQVIGSKSSSKELNELVKRLGELHQSSQVLLHASQLGGRRPISRQITGPLPIKDKHFGYNKEYADLLSCLSSGDDRVVAIVGHAGMGKTELCRRAFHDVKNGSMPKHFQVEIWVCVYGKFSETELLREIWKSASGREPVGEMNVTSLQRELEKLVRNKRYLLVLDDVCNDESVASESRRKDTWEAVLSPFKRYGEKGSRILVTTRAKICCDILKADARITLNGVDTGAAELLLKSTALGDEHAAVPRNLQEVFQDHVRKLYGSPLAAEEVGSMLKGNLNPVMWKQNLKGDHPYVVWHAHLSSYQDLSPQLQRCFAFCSIFPVDWRFDREMLARMWVALGFVGASSSLHGGNTTEEDVARGYFDDLVQRSFFQTAACKSGASGYYVIHEHTHSMLRRVCPKYYLTMDGSRGPTMPIPLTVRHLSVTTSCLDQLTAYPDDGLKKVRTLLVFDDATCCSSSTTPLVTTIDSGVLRKFKGVRVLDFSDTHIVELPDNISELKHLRYLGLPRTVKKLGAHVTKLYLLQTLGIIDKKNGRLQDLQGDLPDEMSSLTNLRHLGLYLRYIANIRGIGSLDKLQGSVEFRAGKSEEGRSMKELEKLNSLRKMLSIKGLETVSSTKESQSAVLDKKEHLKVLKLEWEPRRVQEDETLDSAVLEGLQPHPNLEKLHITRYLGKTSPEWLANPQVLGNLRSLYLRNCRKLQALPLVGRLPHLELLHIKELWSVNRIDSLFCCSGAFRSLEKMVLEDMPVLEAWDAGTAGGDPKLFPQLKEVRILDCPKLESLPGLLCCRLSLTDLHIERCPAVKAIFIWSSFPSLKREKLHIQGCPSLQFVESPAEQAAAPCPTHHGRCLVSGSSLLFICLWLCILYQLLTLLVAATH